MEKKHLQWGSVGVVIVTLLLLCFAFITPNASRNFFVRILLILLIYLCSQITITYRDKVKVTDPLFYLHAGRSGIGLNPRHKLGYKIYIGLIPILVIIFISTFF
ncbi:hypothetical protein [Streptococcus merionis]|uniref:hypothetical protein n=1 Tax=Streptococcus merionis TaxID=400065 RepID=UPI0026E9BFD4|nr:hypothetical protein [Streptococcus merionis]